MQSEFYDLMIDKLKEDSEAFIKEQISWVDGVYKPSNYLTSLEDKRKKLASFLERISGKELDKDEQEKFRKRFTELAFEYGEKLTDRKERLAGKAKINKFLKKLGLLYEIKATQNSKNWVINRVVK